MNLSPANKNYCIIFYTLRTKYHSIMVAFSKGFWFIIDSTFRFPRLLNKFWIFCYFTLHILTQSSVTFYWLWVLEDYLAGDELGWCHTYEFNSWLHSVSKTNPKLLFDYCLVWWELACKIRDNFAFEYKINKSNAKVTTHYRITVL